MVLRSKLQKYIESSTVYILKGDGFKYRKKSGFEDKKFENRSDSKDKSDSKDRKIRDGHMVRSWDCDRDKSMWRI